MTIPTAPALDDDALGAQLAPDATPEERRALVAALDPARRRTYEALIHVAAELAAGRTPPGVIACA